MMLQREHEIVGEIREAREWLHMCKQDYLRIKDFAAPDKVQEAKDAWDNAKFIWKSLVVKKRRLGVF